MEAEFIRNGEFVPDGVSLDRLLAECPTPVYLYSAGSIRRKYGMLAAAFPGYDFFYSFKANPNLNICRMLLEMGACADVSSMGELKAALSVGFRPENIAFVGPGKTDEEIAFAIEKGIYAIAAESAYEIRTIESTAARLGRQARVLLRINTLEEPISPEMMVGQASKFGIDEESVVEEVGRIKLKHARIIGVHVYSASQVLDTDFIAGHLGYVLDLSLGLARALDFDLECIDFGGGFGVPYGEGETELDLEPIAKAARDVRRRLQAERPACRMIFEVGRYLVAEAGVFLTRAIRVKPSRGKTFIITDGGMNHFSRPVFMRVAHPVRLVNKIAMERNTPCSVAGPICTPVDVVARDVMLPEPEPGDIVGIFGAGAYGYTMSILNFMSLGWPAEVMVEGGRIRLIRKPKPAEAFFPDQA